jgi:hypothetical protein
MPDVQRCTGHCCQLFLLPCAPDEMWDRQHRTEDGVVIADMVIYLGFDTCNGIREHLGLPPHSRAMSAHSHWYTCRH